MTHEEYRRNLEMMVTTAGDGVKGFIFVSPYVAEPDVNDPLRREMDIYREICRETAEGYSCIFVDIQRMFDEYFRYRHQCLIAWDRIHPNRIGAYLIAKEILKTAGFDYDHI